jgi:hypothetical protein
MGNFKRGQVTIFIVISLIIIVGVVLFFVSRDRLNPNFSKTPVEFNSITDEIQNCAEATLKDGTKLIGLQGGYILPPESALETNFSSIAYGYNLGNNILVLKSTIEKEIANYIQLVLPSCFDSSSFPQYRITTGKPKATVKISSDSLSASVSYPLTLKKTDSTYNLDKPYRANYKIQLGNMYSVAQELISKETQNPGNIDFNYLQSLGYDISILYFGENIFVYSIKDSNINGTGGYTFRFANKIK